jgi:hypothetical protein
MKLSQHGLKEHIFIVYTHVEKRQKKKTQRTNSSFRGFLDK